MRKCEINDCDRKHYGRGWCLMHYMRNFRRGNPEQAMAYPSREKHHAWAGDKVGYFGAHRRVEAVRGYAKEYACSHCLGFAFQWAYDHEDSNQLISPVGAPYSLNVRRYLPLCSSCHKKFDIAHKSLAATQGESL